MGQVDKDWELYQNSIKYLNHTNNSFWDIWKFHMVLNTTMLTGGIAVIGLILKYSPAGVIKLFSLVGISIQ
ncbi:MAG: hypothetical protein IH840_14000 [Candidatus Heimdallarchaeota archaeon]|nr:hypothetical protein [Candidatus Heimdallarchaeota archaeon]